MPRASPVGSKNKRGQNAKRAGQTIERLRETALNTSSRDRAALVAYKPLTTKQRDFIRFWAQGETILSASVRAGYNDGGTYAYRIAKMPQVLALYAEEKRKYEEASGMTRKRVVEGLLESIDMAKLISEPGSMISGWREIAKMCGYYAPVEKKLTIDHTSTPLLERLNRMSDAELLKALQDDSSQVIDVVMTEVSSPEYALSNDDDDETADE